MKKWYVIHTRTGYEERMKKILERRISKEGLKEQISKIFIPTEQVSEVKRGKKKISERKFFPGYVLVNMEFNEKTWYVVKNTPGVTGFIAAGKEPLALKEEEVENIIKESEEKKIKPAPKVVFEKGEPVRVNEGPFVNFNGKVEEIFPEKGKLKVSVLIFGRSTPVELEYWQVEKI